MALSSAQAMKRVMQEVQELVTNPPEGIKLIPNDEDLTDLTALLKGPEQTPFEGGVFKIKLKLGQDFPAAPPKGAFLTKIFHPNVSLKGEICVNTLKKDWKPEMGIRHVLLTIKCLMITPNPESALNEEAGRLLIESYDEYCKHAKLMTGVHAKGKWEEKEEPKPASEAAPVPTEGDADKKENDPQIGNTVSSAPTKPVGKPTVAPAAAKTSAQQVKQKKSLKRL